MAFVAAAIIGSTVVGGVMSYVSGKRAENSARKGADRAADATTQNTQLQIDEIRRQFDYQQQILLPQVQEQYNAQRTYSDLLGISGPQAGQPGQPQPAGAPGAQPDPNAPPDPRIAQIEQQIAAAQQQTTAGSGGAGTMRRRADARQQVAYLQDQLSQIQQGGAGGPGADGNQLPVMGGPGTSTIDLRRDANGVFVDPNLDPTSLADTETLSGVVQGNLQAGTTAENDPYQNFIQNNQIAAGNVDQSILAQRADQVRVADGAAGTGVYGDTFNQSPGYNFQVEEMNRALDRKGSAGGANIGGRAIMEAQRRAQGLAAGEYYNWAQGRERDLGRRGQAEAMDISRGDQAYQVYENQRISDVARGDRGYENYLNRRQGDASRLDAAAGNRDRLQASDQARQDQSYYNYINAVQRQAGFGGGPAATAVNASQATGGAVANAYGNQGASLSNIYQNQGISTANAQYAQGAGVNNALQSGAQNWLTYKAAA